MGGLARLRSFTGSATLFVGIVIGSAAIEEALADPPPARITIGELTFIHELATWEIVRKTGGLVATCVQEDCQGAVLDISRRDGEAGCTEETMVAEAERLFPVQGRAYANVVRAGRFALVLAERHDGPDLGSPAFVHACVAWQGSEYRFVMRPHTVGKQSWIGGALHYLVSRAKAPAARVERVRIGDVSFDIPSDAWNVSWVVPTKPSCSNVGYRPALSRASSRSCHRTRLRSLAPLLSMRPSYSAEPKPGLEP